MLIGDQKVFAGIVEAYLQKNDCKHFFFAFLSSDCETKRRRAHFMLAF